MNPWRPVELALTGGARLLWPAFQAINRRFEGRAFHPKWSAAPLLKSHERSMPQLGWPRTTDSLCPTCVREARTRILSGEQAVESLVNEKVGEIKAHDLRAGRQGRRRKDVPEPRHLRRYAVDQPRVPAPHRIALSRSRLPGDDGSTPQPRHVVHQVRPRRGADDRPDQPLQHDVRSRASWMPIRSATCTN